uniref:hypothetical protein n=1 Tax=Streptomyces sp. CA-136453 TaxID=3240050 RepID=UPI003F49703F
MTRQLAKEAHAMTTATPARRTVTAAAVKVPTPYQRKKMIEALSADQYRLPSDTDGRSLDVMLDQRWILEYTHRGRLAGSARAAGYEGFTHFRLTAKGRLALLTPAKRAALESADQYGRLKQPIAWPTEQSLDADGFIMRLTERGQVATGQEHHPFISNLGRRVLGLAPVDETPASDVLIAAFAEWGITTAVETDEDGDTAVIYRHGPIVARFYRFIGDDDWQHSATHPAWMHDSPWYGEVAYGMDQQEICGPDEFGDVNADSAGTAEAFAEWLTSSNVKI